MEQNRMNGILNSVRKKKEQMPRDLWHTDLAVELRESFPGDGGEIPGVAVEEYMVEEAELKVTKVEILDEAGAKSMGKPVGTYLTLEADFQNYEEACIGELANAIGTLLPAKARHILTVGLGNRNLTADSLGPLAVSHVWINAHVLEEGGMCGISPGVMAQTGMETACIIQGIVEKEQPDAVIVIDALAARSSSRLGHTIQLTDTGICPGSGVGNHRLGMNEESLGVPVLAIGVPTVISAAVIAGDTMDAIQECLRRQPETAGAAQVLQELPGTEKQRLIQELLGESLRTLLVTPKNIDETVDWLGTFIAAGINQAMDDRIRWE